MQIFAVGVLAMVAYLRVAPLGVTAEISSRARQVAAELALLPPRLEGLDTLRGCVNVVKDLAFFQQWRLRRRACDRFIRSGARRRPVPARLADLWTNGARHCRRRPSRLGRDHRARLRDWTLLSGVMAGALSGWIFGLAIFGGLGFALWIGRADLLRPR